MKARNFGDSISAIRCSKQKNMDIHKNSLVYTVPGLNWFKILIHGSLYRQEAVPGGVQ